MIAMSDSSGYVYDPAGDPAGCDKANQEEVPRKNFRMCRRFPVRNILRAAGGDLVGSMPRCAALRYRTELDGEAAKQLVKNRCNRRC